MYFDALEFACAPSLLSMIDAFWKQGKGTGNVKASLLPRSDEDQFLHEEPPGQVPLPGFHDPPGHLPQAQGRALLGPEQQGDLHLAGHGGGDQIPEADGIKSMLKKIRVARPRRRD